MWGQIWGRCQTAEQTAMPCVCHRRSGPVGLRHAKAIGQVDGVTLCAVADPSPKSKDQAEAYKVPYFNTLEELIEAVQPDGIILALPIHQAIRPLYMGFCGL